MTIFAIVAIDSPETLDLIVPSVFARDRCFQLKIGHWLAYSQLNAQAVSKAVGWGETYEGRSGMVYSVSSFFGIANSEVWPWISLNWERTDA